MKGYTRKGFNKEYSDILARVQKAQNKLFWKANQTQVETQTREKMAAYVKKFLSEEQIALIGYTQDDLTDKLVDDLLFYSVLTYPLEDPNVEGITVAAWDNVRVTFRDGHEVAIDHFQSPQHAIDIIKRLLAPSNVTIDEAVPMAEGSIANNIRITALQKPLVDEETGVVCYIRKLSTRIFTREEYLEGDFASAHELDLLETALRRGVSVLLVGKVNTGKTTFLSYLLSRLPDQVHVCTIESGAREMNLIKRGQGDEVKNCVMHLLSRPSSNPQQNITQESLVEKVLRLNADVMSVAEMRNEEAYSAQEASLVGTPIISTAHAGSPRQAHDRVAELCRKKYPTDYATAYQQACRAFPLVAFIHTLPDNKRRIMDLTECVVEGMDIKYHTLYRYEIDHVEERGGQAKVFGRHAQVGKASSSLIAHMRRYGLTSDELAMFHRKEE